MSLQDLDRLMAMRTDDPALASRLKEPLDLEAFLALAAEFGCSITETDVFEAQQREESRRSAEELQRQQAGEARRLRTFIQG